MCCIVYDLQILLRMYYRTWVCRYVSFVVIYCNVICTVLYFVVELCQLPKKIVDYCNIFRRTRDLTIRTTISYFTETFNASGRVFWKIWLPSSTQKLYEKNRQKPLSLNKKWQKFHQGADLAQNWGQIWNQHAWNPYNYFLLDLIGGFKFFSIFWVLICSCLLLLQ